MCREFRDEWHWIFTWRIRFAVFLGIATDRRFRHRLSRRIRFDDFARDAIRYLQFFRRMIDLGVVDARRFLLILWIELVF